MRLDAPRIAPLSDEVLSPELRDYLRNRAASGNVLNIYRTLAHDPDAMNAFLDWGGYILSKRNGLPGRQREIVILRIGYLCRSGYEWTQHARMGAREGLTAEEIEAVKHGADAPLWSAGDAALIRAADELHASQFITDATWADLSRHFSPKQCTDAILTAGQYTLVSMFLNSVGVQLDAGQVLDPDLAAY